MEHLKEPSLLNLTFPTADSYFTKDKTLSAQEDEIIQVMVLTSGTLACIGCLFVIGSYFYFRVYRQYHLRLILYLIVSDLISSAVSILGNSVRRHQLFGEHTCDISAAALEGFQLSSILWMACIAHTVNRVIRLKDDEVERFEKFYHIICWGVPLGIDIFLWVRGLFTDAGIWCWIVANPAYYRFIFFYCILWIVFVYNVYVAIMISLSLRRERGSMIYGSAGPVSSNSIQMTFRWLLIAYFLAWLPGTINRIQNIFSPEPIFWLYALHAFCVPLQGFFDALIYGFNDEIRQQWHELRIKLNCCRSREEGDAIVSQEEWNLFYRQTITEYDNHLEE
eukprot:TRINITY_DN4921_c0_g1_i1.p1 TRINITY_DN4921_c0_g1~~TRINITY_DN4921_c0_g1_i1.p1  ORF type:complete len:345 (-),score=37.65 TRINITY_DN4921_c0_g1_i1:30-1037(-)